MKLTEQDKLNLMRFGCTLQPRQKLLYIRWPDEREKAINAPILARFIHNKLPSGPLLSLTFEISPIRALARYCYFPFNLQNASHRNYLSSLAETGKLVFAFLVRGREILREYQFSDSRRKRIDAIIAEVSDALQAHGSATYNFSHVIDEFERTVRLSTYFERAFSEHEITELRETIRKKAEEISFQRRVLARQIMTGFKDVLLERYGDFIAGNIENLTTPRVGLLLMFDLYREFGSDYERITEFLADIVAVGVEEDVLSKGLGWPSRLKSLIQLADQAGSAPEAEQQKVISDLGNAFAKIFADLKSGRALSLTMLQNLLLPLRPLLTAQPGRPIKDYSREYEWKASGSSWAEVAAQHLTDNAETRAEFGGRDFQSLNPEEKENLTNRIRAGVTSYAERAGKEIPDWRDLQARKKSNRYPA